MTGGPDTGGYTERGTPRVSIAPMMDWTDRHYRYFIRHLTRRTLLYTEMVTTGAIIHGDRDRFLAFDPLEHPVALQIGGDTADDVARSVEIAEEYGYDEYNLNVGCPSDKVQEGNFGACLMATPDRVAEITAAMREVTDRPVSVKQRIGIDGRESYEEMLEFVDTVAASGVERFTVHARIAILAGLSPKQNRTIPPIRYEDVYRLKRERPQLEIGINGQIRTVDDVRSHLAHVDTVMVGRAAYEQPWLFATVDEELFGDEPAATTREQVVEALFPYMDYLDRTGQPPRRMINHLLGLFAGRPGARRWKQALSGRLPAAPGREILRTARDAVPEEIRQES
ncbi:MAG: tRNA dihydrouridine(20/20a) synthase DusA [Spirochaeta sp.]|jgi:tRNA-dihydrouridine synthase A|nr:tRNA dihydrouridine(20/20a) synthase DusA [Spirochaeta sp.]